MAKATKKKVSIILTGVGGVGKSTLFANLLKIEISNLMDPNPLTKELEPKTKEVNGVDVTLVDTPGILTSKGVSEELKKKLKSHDVDLLVLCISVLPHEKFSYDHNREIKIMKCLHNNFGRDIWKRCVIVFTFSNQLLGQIKCTTRNENETREAFKAQLQETMDAVQDELSQLDRQIVAEVDPRTIFNWDETYHGRRPVGHTILGIPAGFEKGDSIPLPNDKINWTASSINANGEFLLKIETNDIQTRWTNDTKKTHATHYRARSTVRIFITSNHDVIMQNNKHSPSKCS